MQARPTTRQAGLSPPITPRVDTNTRTDSSIPTTLIFCCTPIIRWTGILGVLRRLRKQKKKTNRSSSRSGTALATGVMLPKRTIYSNPDIAKLMNQWFVNVKVDSEQRPDVDRIYMLARLIMTGGGGWPNNLFLTPDLKPFYAGSYFPPTPASFDFLIPTSLEFKDIKPAKIEYPSSTRFTAKFAPEGLDVYEGSVAITARFSKDSLTGIKAIKGTLTAQACTDQICLSPSTLPVSIGNDGQ